MRDLGASLPTYVARTYTSPVYLLDIEFSSFVYLSSREFVQHDTGSGQHNYIPHYVKAVDVRDSKATLTLVNDDRSMSAQALTGQIRGNTVRIHLYYEGISITRFEGEIDSIEVQDTGNGSFVTINIVGTGAVSSRWPSIRITPAVGANFLPPPDLTFTYGDKIYIIERSE